MEIDYIRVYQSADMKITGPAYLETDQSATYQSTSFSGGSYEWQVPADARITSGAGTSEIKVTWGDSEGDVSCKVTLGSSVFSAVYPVKKAILPAENTFWFGNLTDGNTTDIAGITTDGNTYEFSESNESLKVIYHIVNPSTWPKFEITLPRPVNLKNHPYCAINLKTSNLSHSVSLRFDFADVNGVETNATPVFRPTITADGRYHNYQNNYTGRWISSSPVVGQKVDSTRIMKLITYVNSGAFGIANKTDSLWIESIRFMKSPLTSVDQAETSETDIHIFPNPVTDHLTISSNYLIEEIILFDIHGKQVKRVAINSRASDINVSDLAAGVYLLRTINGAGVVATQRFVKK
jgi:hypothetical protein